MFAPFPKCLSTPVLSFWALFHPATQSGLVFTWDCFRDFVNWFWFRHFVDWFCSRTQPHTNPFLAAAWEKKLLTANSSEGNWQCLQRTDLTLCHGLFSSQGFSFGLEGKQGCREEKQWQNSPQLTNYSCPLGWLTKGNSQCQEAQKEGSEQEFSRGEKSKIPNCVGTETGSSFTS